MACNEHLNVVILYINYLKTGEIFLNMNFIGFANNYYCYYNITLSSIVNINVLMYHKKSLTFFSHKQITETLRGE